MLEPKIKIVRCPKCGARGVAGKEYGQRFPKHEDGCDWGVVLGNYKPGAVYFVPDPFLTTSPSPHGFALGLLLSAIVVFVAVAAEVTR